MKQIRRNKTVNCCGILLDVVIVEDVGDPEEGHPGGAIHGGIIEEAIVADIVDSEQAYREIAALQDA